MTTEDSPGVSRLRAILQSPSVQLGGIVVLATLAHFAWHIIIGRKT